MILFSTFWFDMGYKGVYWLLLLFHCPLSHFLTSTGSAQGVIISNIYDHEL